MKALLVGRIVFGVSAIAAGIVCAVWPDSDVWQHLSAWHVPFAAVVVWAFAVAQVAGGAAIALPQTVRAGAVTLGAVYLLTSLATIPDMLAGGSSFGAWVNLGEQFSLVCGALAVLGIGTVARIGMGLCTLSFAAAQIVYLKYTASLVPAYVPPNGTFWTNVTTGAFGLAGIALLIDRQGRLAMRLMALMIALFGLMVWVPHLVANPKSLSDWNEISTNYLIAGAALLVAEMKTGLRR